MEKINVFDVIKQMSLDNEKTLRMFPGDTNFIESKIGKNGWGKVTMVVDNETIQELVFDGKTTVCALLFYNTDKYRETEQKIMKEI
jgi:hypothetical protein